MTRKIPVYDDYPQIGRVRLDPSLALANSDPLLIARGLVTGISQVNKFGENPDSAVNGTEDVWDGGGTYVFPTTADITHIRQAVDQAAMRGATIQVQGLDTDWALTLQDVVLDATNSTTPVALTTALKRVFRMKVQANVVTTQNIELRNVGGGTTYAIIRAGFNQTLMAIYTVPAGKTAYITQYYADNTVTATRHPDSVKINLWMADRAAGYEFQIKHQRGIPLQGDGFNHPFMPPMKITEKTDIKISATVVGSAGEDGNPHAGFDLILIDND
jgi:hypothetical protein